MKLCIVVQCVGTISNENSWLNKTIAGCGCKTWPIIACNEIFSYSYLIKMKNPIISKPLRAFFDLKDSSRTL